MIEPDMQAPRILILDDDDHYALLFSAYLKLSGVEGGTVQHASSTESAVEQLPHFAPDMVFLDNRIPPYSDFRTSLSTLRNAGYKGPIVVQSACLADKIFDEAKRLGVAEVVDKLEMNDHRLIELLERHTAFTRS